MHHDAYSKKHHPESDSSAVLGDKSSILFFMFASTGQQQIYLFLLFYCSSPHLSPICRSSQSTFRKRQLTERVTYVGGGSDIITNNSSRNSGHPRFRYSHGSSSARGLGAFIIYLSSRSTQCFHQNNKTSRLHS